MKTKLLILAAVAVIIASILLFTREEPKEVIFIDEDGTEVLQ